jgi:hypothetical protein
MIAKPDPDLVPWPATILWGAVVFLFVLVVLWLRGGAH